jgi:hypothetical protein
MILRYVFVNVYPQGIYIYVYMYIYIYQLAGGVLFPQGFQATKPPAHYAPVLGCIGGGAIQQPTFYSCPCKLNHFFLPKRSFSPVKLYIYTHYIYIDHPESGYIIPRSAMVESWMMYIYFFKAVTRITTMGRMTIPEQHHIFGPWYISLYSESSWIWLIRLYITLYNVKFILYMYIYNIIYHIYIYYTL